MGEVKDLDGLQLECLRCGSKWLRRKLEDPVECPRCKSRYWNKPRRKDVPS